MYDNIGSKIKALAKGIFIVEAIGSIITGCILGAEEDELYFLLILIGPIVAWVSSWILYAFGELVEKTSNNESNTNNIVKILKEQIYKEKNDNIPQKQDVTRKTDATQKTDIIDQNGFIIQNKTLIKYNGNETNITIPNNIECIQGQAFLRNKNIISVTILQGANTICEWAFYQCARLEKITIPNSVTKIGANSFYGCDLLTISAPTGSYAELFAKENNMKFEPI